MVDTTSVVVALGSNLGDRVWHLQEALRQIQSRGLLTEMQCSHAYESPPERPEDGEPFVNAVAIGECSLSPRTLLENLLHIEHAMGRRRSESGHGGARIIDLDLILYGDQVIREPGLEVPHPRYAKRSFVLMPLAEIAGERIDPQSGTSIHSMWTSAKEATHVAGTLPAHSGTPVALRNLGSLCR